VLQWRNWGDCEAQRHDPGSMGEGRCKHAPLHTVVVAVFVPCIVVAVVAPCGCCRPYAACGIVGAHCAMCGVVVTVIMLYDVAVIVAVVMPGLQSLSSSHPHGHIITTHHHHCAIVIVVSGQWLHWGRLWRERMAMHLLARMVSVMLLPFPYLFSLTSYLISNPISQI